MSRGLRRQAPTLVIAGLALVAALSGTVYAAGKINGRSIKMKSMPGNRLALGSVPGNRLKPGALQGSQLAPGSITGIQIDASTLGQVPSAIHADTAESARDAETALNAANAENARTVNGHEVGCRTGTRPFAGACWQTLPSDAALNAPRSSSSLRKLRRRAPRRAVPSRVLAAAGGDVGGRRGVEQRHTQLHDEKLLQRGIGHCDG